MEVVKEVARWSLACRRREIATRGGQFGRRRRDFRAGRQIGEGHPSIYSIKRDPAGQNQSSMALMRVKWLALGAAVGLVGGWKTKSNAREVEKLVEAVAPRPAAKQIADLLSNGSADKRQKRRLEESLRDNARAAEESIRKQEETIWMHKDTMRKQDEIIRLLQTVLQRLQESDDRVLQMQKLQCPPPVLTAPSASS